MSGIDWGDKDREAARRRMEEELELPGPEDQALKSFLDSLDPDRSMHYRAAMRDIADHRWNVWRMRVDYIVWGILIAYLLWVYSLQLLTKPTLSGAIIAICLGTVLFRCYEAIKWSRRL